MTSHDVRSYMASQDSVSMPDSTTDLIGKSIISEEDYSLSQGRSLMKRKYVSRSGQSNYGIYRVDSEPKGMYGWRVSLTRRKKIYTDFFADAKCGGRIKSLITAKKYRDSVANSAASLKRSEYAAIRRRNNSSGIAGVFRNVEVRIRGDVKIEYVSWSAFWPSHDGKRKTKRFSVSRFGEAGAFHLAVEAREMGLRTLQGDYVNSKSLGQWIATERANDTKDAGRNNVRKSTAAQVAIFVNRAELISS
jgi:hypothetical protein